MFEAMGVPVYDADTETKKLYQTHDGLKQQLIQHFGPNTYVNGVFNPQHIREMVFSNPEKRAFLNSLVHPVVINEAARWLSSQKAPYVIKEAALLFESGSQRDLDLIIGVTAPVDLRIKRVMKRDHLNREEVFKRMESQIDDSIKMRLCDVVVINNEIQPLLPQVLALHEQFVLRSKNHK